MPVETPSPQNPEEYRVINLKYRPQTFSEVVGQRSVVKQLQGEIRDNRVAHAYLFTGPRGVGKTSMARIFAKALNCVEGPTPSPCGKCTHCLGIANDADLDVVEVDAATYTKKDETIELLEGIDRAAFNARYKVYIIDEVHMFSTHSFNVLLKRLEEPPPMVVFILATTNPEKIPETVVSRCRKFDFERMEMVDIVQRLSEIADKENVVFADGEKDEVLQAVALASEGGMRDAQVALDQLISLSDGPITIETARLLLGIVESDLLLQLMESVVNRDTTACLQLIQTLVDKGRDLHRFIKTFTTYLRDAMLIKANAPENLLKISRANHRQLSNAVAKVSMPTVLNMMQQFLELEERLRSAAPSRFLLEFTLIKLTAIHPRFVLDALSNDGQGGGPPDGGGGGAPRRAQSPPRAASPKSPARMEPRGLPGRTPDSTTPRAMHRTAMPVTVMRSSGAAEAEELGDVLLEDPPSTPQPVSTEEGINQLKSLADERLVPALRGIISAAEITFPEDDLMLVTIQARDGVMAPSLERPESRAVLADIAQKVFGRDMRIRFDRMELSPVTIPDRDDGDSSDDHVAEDAELYATPPPVAAPASKKNLTFKQALDRFPDFREAINLVRKHCGTDPVLFNGERI